MKSFTSLERFQRWLDGFDHPVALWLWGQIFEWSCRRKYK